MPTTDQITFPDDLLPIGEVASMLQCSVGTVRRWTAQGALPSIRTPDNQRRYRREDVEALLEAEGR
jgi:excisionase family DNA binding protein